MDYTWTLRMTPLHNSFKKYLVDKHKSSFETSIFEDFLGDTKRKTASVLDYKLELAYLLC